MEPKERSVNPGISGNMPSNQLSNLLGGKAEPVSPEIAAEHAANRIIQAVRELEKVGRKLSDNT